MDPKKPAYFDLETVALLRETLDDAWACLRPQERATTSRTQLAEGILAWRQRASAIQTDCLMPR